MEILVVLCIAAVLAGLYMIAGPGLRRGFRVRQVRADLLTLSEGIEKYRGKHGTPKDPGAVDEQFSGNVGELLRLLESWGYLTGAQYERMMASYGPVRGTGNAPMFYVASAWYKTSPIAKERDGEFVCAKRYQLWHAGEDGLTDIDADHTWNADDVVARPGAAILESWEGVE